MNRTLVAILATLDTKADAAALLQQTLLSMDITPLLIDTGLKGDPSVVADIPHDVVLARTGTLPAGTSEKIQVYATSLQSILIEVHDKTPLSGVIGLGGGKGSHLCAAAMRALPFGVPKVLISTIATRAAAEMIDTSDMVLVPAVADIHGLNRITRSVLTRAAVSVAAMSKMPVANTSHVKTVAITALGATEPLVQNCAAQVVVAGCEPVVFHCTGTGGAAMEQMIAANVVQCTLDLTLSEIANDLFGGRSTAGPDRLKAAGRAGIPQIVAPCGFDMLMFRGDSDVPRNLSQRTRIQHTPTATLIRTDPDENYIGGAEVARRLLQSTGPACLLIPRNGFSEYDKAGAPFFNPRCAAAFETGARHAAASTGMEIIGLDMHANDATFAEAVMKKFSVYTPRH